MLKDVLVFSDLDGTLLDHNSYSFAPALATLEKLRSNNIPVIPNTSKTFAELAELRNQLKLDGPFIVENGAGVYMPIGYFSAPPPDIKIRNGYWVKEFTHPRDHWLALLEKLKKGNAGEFTHFSNMTNEQIIAATGLTAKGAKLAATREYGEPILWLGSDSHRVQFIQAIEELGGTPLLGGRFLHLSGDSDKGKALAWLSEQYKTDRGLNQCTSIALGDGQNDVAMLEAADIAVRILSPANPPPSLMRQTEVYTSQAYGPKGWSECLELIIFNDSQLNL